MIPVCCLICLRSDRKLSSLDCFELENFYDELCEYGARITAVPKFCYECIYKMKKCYEFKKSCLLAAEKLKTWWNDPQAVQKPMSLLYKQMPIQLSMCNKNNYKVYFYQSTDVKFPTSIQMSSSNHPHIVTVNIPGDKNIEKLDCEIENVNEHDISEQNIKTEVIDVADNANQTLQGEGIYKLKIELETESLDENLQDDELGSADDVSDFEKDYLNGMNDTGSDSDGSVKELENFLEKLRKPKKTLLEMTDTKINTDSESEHEIVSDSKETMKPKRKRKKRVIGDKRETKSKPKKVSKTMKPNRKRKKTVIEHSESEQEIVSDIDETVKPAKYVRKKKVFDLKPLKAKLKEKFEQYGPIKDSNEKIIDPDVILNNLDKMQWMGKTINKICSGSGPLENYVITKLSSLQDDVTLYASVFDTLLIEDPEQMKAEFEKRRDNAYYKKYAHRCEICFTSFPYRKWLDHHMKMSHDPEAPLECTLCHMRFRRRKHYNTHRRTHKIEYKCKLCEFVTGSRSTMIAHYNKHKGILYNCKYCEDSFKSQASLFNHIKTHNPKHICQLCASAFMTENGLVMHNYRKHNKDEKFVESEHNKKCEECNIIFISEAIYNEHLKISHKRSGGPGSEPRVMNNEKNGDYLCPICGKLLKYRYDIEAHSMKHAGTKPFACSKCPKSFFTKEHLKIHMQRHFPPTHACQVCDKKFTTKSGLYNHNRIHLNDRRFVCKICGKGFLYNAALREHVDGVHYNIRKRKRTRQKDSDSE